MKNLIMRALVSIFLVCIETVVTLDVFPALDKPCRSSEVCATRDSCPYWEDWWNEVKNLPRRNSERLQYLSEAKSAICNNRRRAVCCPQTREPSKPKPVDPYDIGTKTLDDANQMPDYIPKEGECGNAGGAESIYGNNILGCDKYLLT